MRWALEGERNTKFYHAIAKGKLVRNKIRRIRDERGVWLDSKVEIVDHVVSFFASLYKSEVHEMEDELFEVVPKLISNSDNEVLTGLASMAEVKGVVFSMSVESAPRVDGFFGKFFQVAWELIKEDLLLAVNFFLRGGVVLRSVNATLLALIPKKLNPEFLLILGQLACIISYTRYLPSFWLIGWLSLQELWENLTFNC